MKNNLIVQQILIINEIDNSGYQEVRNPMNNYALSYVKHDCSKEDIEFMLSNIPLNDSYIYIINKNKNKIKFDASDDAITRIYEFMNNNINIEKPKEIHLQSTRLELIDCDNIIFINYHGFKNNNIRTNLNFKNYIFDGSFDFDGDYNGLNISDIIKSASKITKKLVPKDTLYIERGKLK